MTTIVNNPAPTNDSNSSGFLIGIVVIVVFLMLFLYFGLPAIRNMGAIKVNVPAPQIVVPDKINVNIQQSK